MLPESDKPDQQEQIDSDETDSWFWRPHTLTALTVFLISLAYFALFETSYDDTVLNTKRGLLFASIAFLYIAMTHTKNGPFLRPHPIIWRLVLSASVLYELVLIFMLFQTADDARKLLTYLYPELGQPLDEIDYSTDCRIYDSDHPEDPYHNVWDKMDWFVIFHLTGWWAKAIVFRDYWMSFVLSVTFEILEYSLEHQLPNFGECWWDHWILDAIICNGLGIWLGIKTLEFLESKTYDWRDLWSIPGSRGKVVRVLSQFTPYSWTKFDWGYTEDVNRWFAVIGICASIMIYDLNTFYLKAVLWIPPPHPANVYRCMLILFMGAVAPARPTSTWPTPSASASGSSRGSRARSSSPSVC